jgi:predicted RNA-binding protein (virulence factor B family)
MIELLGYFVLGWLIYVLVSAWVTLQNIKGAVNDVVERNMINAAVERQILVARMEPVEQGDHTVVLAYNNNTEKFLGQAATQEQVEALLKEKYPNMNIVVVNESATIEDIHSVDTKPI